ncbi:hypothetical protein D3C76_1661490 [compost metagenome]
MLHPCGQVRVESVIHPLALAAIQQQAAASQLRQVPADFWLAVVQGAHQLADAELAQVGDEQGGAGAGLVGQVLEDLGRSNHGALFTYG